MANSSYLNKVLKTNVQFPDWVTVLDDGSGDYLNCMFDVLLTNEVHANEAFHINSNILTPFKWEGNILVLDDDRYEFMGSTRFQAIWQKIQSKDGASDAQIVVSRLAIGVNAMSYYTPELPTYLLAVVSLLEYLQTNSPQEFAIVSSLIDYNYVTMFYLLIEPFKADNYLIQTNTIATWATRPQYDYNVANAKTKYLKFINAVSKDVTSFVDCIRGPSITGDATVVIAAYNSMLQSNRCGTVFPKTPTPEYRLWADLLRFKLSALSDVKTIHNYVAGSFTGNKISEEISAILTPKLAIVTEFDKKELVYFQTTPYYLYYTYPIDRASRDTGPIDLSRFNNILYRHYLNISS